MDITPLIPEGRKIIQSYGKNGFRISGSQYGGGVLVFPDRAEDWDAGARADAMTLDRLDAIVKQASDIDVLIVGCGAQLDFSPLALRRALREKGIVAEFMDTGAACRTYNVLMAEGRRVAAALFPLN